MNIAVIFAGGTGQRMNSRTKPKQFLLVHGKPIIIYTLEAFDQHPDIDAIVVVCLKEYIDVLEQLIAKFGVGKIAAIVPGGSSGQDRSATASTRRTDCIPRIRSSSFMTVSGR